MKKSIKKVFAIGVSVALLATTMVGALADLSTYPAPFVDNKGVFNGAIVVGENAATSDVLGAIDIAASLQADAKQAVATGSSSVVVEGGDSFDDLYLGTQWPSGADKALKENKLTGFVDSDFDVGANDDTVDYHDELIISQDGVTFNAQDDEDANGVYAEVAKNAINYKVYFEDPEIETATVDDSAEFKILGQNVEAYGFDFGANGEFTVVSSTEKSMVEGDEVTLAGHTVKLVRVGADSVIVDVDGQTKVVDNNGDEKFDEADDFEVEVDSVFYIEGASDNIANLKLGTALTDDAKDNDPAELFGQVDDDDEADWVWIVGNDSNGRYVGISNNKAYDKLDIQNADEEKSPLYVGDEIVLPNDYASVVFESLVADYNDVEISLDTNKFLDDGEDSPNNEGYYNVVEFSSDNDIFKLSNGDTAEKVWFAYDMDASADINGTWYEDGDDETFLAGQSFQVEIDSELLTVAAPNNATSNNMFTITDKDGGVVSFSVSDVVGDEFEYFGNDDESDQYDILVDGSNVDTKDFDIQTTYGIKIADPDNQFSSGDSFMISIPSEAEAATIVVKSMGSSVASASSGSAYMVNPIEVGMGMLDSEATLGSKPMIVIGGPYANSVAKELLGFPTDEEIMATFTEGKAMIKWFDNEQAMLVAGYSAQDTRGASYVVADYDQYDFEGSELEVVVTDLKNIDVMAK